MKKIVGILLISCSLMIAVPNTAEAIATVSNIVNVNVEKPGGLPCVEQVYRNYFFKKNLGKMEGVRRKTTNHDHSKRFLGKKVGLRIETLNYKK